MILRLNTVPGDKMGVLVADEENNDEWITYLMVTNNIKDDWTINNGDRFMI